MSGPGPQNAVSANGVGAVLDANLNAFVQTGQTAAILRSFIGIAGMSVTLPGLTAAGDGGSGIFYWAAGSYTDNARTVIVPPGAAGEGAWLRAASLYATPTYTVAGLPTVTSANQGQVAYATNGRNTGEGSGVGTGCLCTVNANGAWAAVWSGVPVSS
jgi:hypothetical protein